MKPLIFLEYAFLFEPSASTWAYLHDFERDLAKFFASQGLEAQIVKTIEGQPSGKRILYIVKMETPEVIPPGGETKFKKLKK